MTWRPDTDRESGFTLIEILAVLTVLGLALILITARGPAHSPGVDQRAAAAGIADALRLARSQAIAANRPRQVLFDAETRLVLTPDGAARHIPDGLSLTLRQRAGPDVARLAIGFAPDGGSTGGAVEIAAGAARLRVTAAWLSGRISIADVR